MNKKIVFNKLIYAVDAMLGLVVILSMFFDTFRTGTEVTDAAGNVTMVYEWMNFFEFCNFGVSGISGVFMYAPMVLVIICVIALVFLICAKNLKSFDNAIVCLMFIAVIIMAIMQSFGYSYPFIIIGYVVAALLLISILPMFMLDKMPDEVKPVEQKQQQANNQVYVHPYVEQPKQNNQQNNSTGNNNNQTKK